MCGIAGVFLNTKNNAGEFLRKMLILINHRGPEGSGIVTDESKFFADSPFNLDDIKGSIGIGHNRLALMGKGVQPISNESGLLWIAHNGEIYNYEPLRRELRKKGHIFQTDIDSEVFLHLFEEGLDSIKMINGDFATLILDIADETIFAFRDPFGIRPLFYCKNDRGIFFASERKALKPFCSAYKRILPGEYIIVSRDGISSEIIKNSYKETEINDEEKVIKDLKEFLIDSVLVRAHDSFGILFSGGVDSTIIAKISKDYNLDFEAITVGLSNSIDIKNAKEAAEELKIPLKVYEFSEKHMLNIASFLPRVIDEFDVMKIMIGVPIFIASHFAKELGFKVLMTGQGADELFGGYHKYLRLSNPEEEMMKDFRNLYLKNLERDDHCAMFNSVEVRFPYLDKRVVSLALSIPLSMKIKHSIRKYILRKLALRLGIPKKIALREKKAIQYGTKTAEVIKKKARRMKISVREFLEWLSLNA